MSKTTGKAGRGARVVPAEEVFAKAHKNPAYREAYDALEEEFALVAKMIRARSKNLARTAR